MARGARGATHGGSNNPEEKARSAIRAMAPDALVATIFLMTSRLRQKEKNDINRRPHHRQLSGGATGAFRINNQNSVSILGDSSGQGAHQRIVSTQLDNSASSAEYPSRTFDTSQVSIWKQSLSCQTAAFDTAKNNI